MGFPSMMPSTTRLIETLAPGLREVSMDIFGITEELDDHYPFDLSDICDSLEECGLDAKVVSEGEIPGIGTLKLKYEGDTVQVYIADVKGPVEDKYATMWPNSEPSADTIFHCWSRLMKDKTADDVFEPPTTAGDAALSILLTLNDLMLHVVKKEQGALDLSHPRRVWHTQ